MSFEIEISAEEARRLVERIRVGVDVIWQLVTQAYTSKAWIALGYTTWDEMCTREFGTSRLRLPREERQEVVASLRESGLSIRAIAAATGDHYSTISRELGRIADATPDAESKPVTGTDGKTYTPKPRPMPDPVPDPVVDERFVSQDELDELNAPLPEFIEPESPFDEDEAEPEPEDVVARAVADELERRRDDIDAARRDAENRKAIADDFNAKTEHLVEQKEAESPWVQAAIAITYALERIPVAIDPDELARNVPHRSRYRLDDIDPYIEWLTRVSDARKELP